MRYQSNLNNVLKALDSAEKRTLTAIGEFVRSESQMRSPVKTGALRDSNDYKVVSEEQKVLVGNNMDYAIWVHESSSRNRTPQPWLRNSVFDNVSRIKSLITEMLRI